MTQKTNVLFLCTGNSCRSQMAEGWARHLKGDVIDVYSAGIETHGLNPHAVKVMAEAGVDISGHRSLIFRDVKVRVEPGARLHMHLDTDEANAADVMYGVVARIIPPI